MNMLMMMSVCRSQNPAHTEDLVGSTDVLTWTLHCNRQHSGKSDNGYSLIYGNIDY